MVKWRSLDEEEKGGEGGSGGGGWVEFDVTANISDMVTSSVWVALGFSSNSKMV